MIIMTVEVYLRVKTPVLLPTMVPSLHSIVIQNDRISRF